MMLSDLLILLIIIAVIIFYNIIKKFLQYKAHKVAEKFGKKEQVLIENLKEKGYYIKSISPEVTAYSQEEGKTYSDHFNYPFMVSRFGKKYLVKIKKEKETIRFSSSRFRKGLLLESLLFNTDGIIIADSSGKFRIFTFKNTGENSFFSGFLFKLVLFLAGSYFGIMLYNYIF